MKKLAGLLIILSTVFSFSCQQNLVSATKGIDNEMVITNGQSFGMCVGPCQQELIISGSEVNFRVLVREGRGSSSPAKENLYDETLSTPMLSAIYSAIDWESFKKLKEVYGCPDCADGGAEWIEIKKGNETHKVTFEYGKSVEGIEKLITLLRENRLKFSQKYVR